MKAIIRKYSGKGAKELMDVLEQRAEAGPAHGFHQRLGNIHAGAKRRRRLLCDCLLGSSRAGREHTESERLDRAERR